jgi:oleate hydratase
MHEEKEETIELTKDDLVFVTNGSCTENSTLGDQNHAPKFDGSIRGCWQLWRNIAKQDPAFGHPDKFCTRTEETFWESSSITTLDDRIPKYIEKICKRDPFSGKVVTGGIISVKDSNWLMCYTVNRQPHFKEQPKDQLVVWVYGLFSEIPGNYIKKPMRECTGVEITQEWLYHMGVPEAEIQDMATKSARSIPCMMPYITAFFMPRTAGDRPKVVPEVFNSCYDVRELLDSTAKMMDGKKSGDTKLPFPLNFVKKKVLKKVSGTVIEDLLIRYKII